MVRRARKDNVIFANFGARHIEPEVPQVPVVDATGAAGHLQRMVFAQSDPGRIQRAREYVRKHKVMNVQFLDGQILAQVAGSQLEPFDVAIVLPYRSTDQVADISAALVREPTGIKQAYAGDLSPQVLELIFGEDASDLRLRCTCPDPAYCCKHVVAVALAAGERLRAKPTEVFELRGLNIASLEQAITQQARQQSQARSDDTSEHFWNGGPLPDLPNPTPASALEDSDPQLLHKALRTVSYSSVEELRGVADIEELFEHLMEE